MKKLSRKFLGLLKLTILLLFVVVHQSCGDDDPKDVAPIVEDQSFTIEENSAIDTQVGTITASDPEGGSLEFNITTGNENQLFNLSTTGVLSTAAILDYETTTSLDLSVGVSDGTNTANATITIDITNVNDISFNGTDYLLVDGVIIDTGTEDEEYDSPHYVYDFSISDVMYELIEDIEDDEYMTGEEREITFGAELLSPGTESFTPGTFKFVDGDINDNEFDDQFVFNDSWIYVKGEREGYSSYFYEYWVTSGTIEVVENDELDYTLTVDVTLLKLHEEKWELVEGTDVDLKFTYSGKFKYEKY